MTVFWVVTLCEIVEGFRSTFRINCVSFQGLKMEIAGFWEMLVPRPYMDLLYWHSSRDAVESNRKTQCIQ
jgi:hypothetical protein